MPYPLRNRRVVFFPLSTIVPALPTEIASLWAWYDVSDIASLFQDTARAVAVAANNDPIGSLGDKSGNGRHAAQTGGTGTRPTYQTNIQNGLPSALFAGGQYLDTTPTLPSLPLTIVGVARTSATIGTSRGLISAYHSTNAGSRVVLANTNVLRSLVANPSASVDTATVAANTTVVFGCRFGAADAMVLLNGSMGSVAHTASAVSNILSVGRTNVNLTSNLLNGHVLEVSVHNRALTNGEIARLVLYLNRKWKVY